MNLFYYTHDVFLTCHFRICLHVYLHCNLDPVYILSFDTFVLCQDLMSPICAYSARMAAVINLYILLQVNGSLSERETVFRNSDRQVITITVAFWH